MFDGSINVPDLTFDRQSPSKSNIEYDTLK